MIVGSAASRCVRRVDLWVSEHGSVGLSHTHTHTHTYAHIKYSYSTFRRTCIEGIFSVEVLTVKVRPEFLILETAVCVSA